MDIWEDKISELRVGTKIPNCNQVIKAQAKSKTRGTGLAYFVNPTKNPKQVKRVYSSEFQIAFDHLTLTGNFTRDWFEKNLPCASSGGGCNFKFIGGVFELLGHASYAGDRSGRFISTKPLNL